VITKELKCKIGLLKKKCAEPTKSLPKNELLPKEQERMALIIVNTLVDIALERIREEWTPPKQIYFSCPGQNNIDTVHEVVRICKHYKMRVHWNYEAGQIVYVLRL